MFSSIAFAQSAQQQGGTLIELLLPLVMVGVIIYFFIIRPQTKRQKRHAQFLKNIQKGDVVITQGGLIGKIVKVSEDEVQMDLSEGTRVSVIKQMIVSTRNDGQAVPKK